MSDERMNVLLPVPAPEFLMPQFEQHFTLHKLYAAADRDAFLADVAPRVRAIATFGLTPVAIDLMQRLPKLEIVAHMGVGYDTAGARWAGEQGIVFTNTRGTVEEETADTAVALLLMTLRQFPQAERHLRAGRWLEAPFPPSAATLRNRTIGLAGMGRIGQAIARRLQAFGRPIVYHSRHPVAGVEYPHYPDLLAMARAVDTLIVIVPGGAATQNLIDAPVLDALGPDGVLINVARGSVVDEAALIAALRERRILSAGLDVYAEQPRVPQELIDMPHVVLLPHTGTASRETRRAMGQRVIDNLRAWAAGEPPLTPVPETPVPKAG